MSVSFKAIIDVMENLAPLTLKEDWDNPGLLVGIRNRKCNPSY